MSAAEQFDIKITQGEDIRMQLGFAEDGVELDLTGYTFDGEIRSTAKTANKMASFAFDLADAETGLVVATIAREVTSKMAVTSGVYDIWWTTPSDQRVPLLRGKVEVEPRVTRLTA